MAGGWHSLCAWHVQTPDGEGESAAESAAELAQVFAADFAGGWLGFWTAPEVLMYGLIWNNFPGGTWEYRWGDQHFWKSALGLFDDGSHIEDVSYVRSAAFSQLSKLLLSPAADASSQTECDCLIC